MKKIIYISILVFFVNSSFIKEKSLQEVLIGNCWVSSSFDNGNYSKKINFHPNKHGLRFINDEEIIIFSRISSCIPGGARNQKVGVWSFLNDSTISLSYKDSKESIITIRYTVRKITNRKIEIEFLSFQERRKGDDPKPMSL